MKLNKEAFTLLEVLLVIVIIGILASLFLPNFGKIQLNSKIVTHNANVRMLKSATSIYLLENPDYEKTIEVSDIKDYLDSDSLKNDEIKPDPTISNLLDGDYKNFSIQIGAKGSINVVPGEVVLDGNKLSFKNLKKE